MTLKDENLEIIFRLIADLKELNKTVPVLVEGKRDREALRRFGLEGTIELVHQGKNLYELSEELLCKYDRIIMLLDWDMRGEALYTKLCEYLKGHYEEFSFIRQTLKRVSRNEFLEVEELVSLL